MVSPLVCVLSRFSAMKISAVSTEVVNGRSLPCESCLSRFIVNSINYVNIYISCNLCLASLSDNLLIIFNSSPLFFGFSFSNIQIFRTGIPIILQNTSFAICRNVSIGSRIKKFETKFSKIIM